MLIVEDDEAARLGLTELVRTWGFTVEAAADGEEALAAVTAFRPTIIVSDLVMPRMDGLQLLAALGDDLSHIYFVLLTAQGTVETAVDAVKHGAEDYLTKPVDPQRLRHLLERLAELSAAQRENTDAAPAAARRGPLRPHRRRQPRDAQGLPRASSRPRRRRRRC